MTRSAVDRTPFDLLPDVEPLPAVVEAFRPERDIDGNLLKPLAGSPTQLSHRLYDHLPNDDRLLAILERGPLLPFDYCWLRGQRQGLVPVVQTQLVKRNPRLSVVDRTPLGIDPNADLFRCFLMHGNPNEPVTVYTFYERHTCAGVVNHYFHLPDVQRNLRDHYARAYWILGERGVPAATIWLAAYDKALDRLFDRLQEAEPRLRARIASDFAEWLFPMMRRADLTDGVHTLAQETQATSANTVRELPANRRIIWEWLGDFTFLSICSRTAFCAFAWMKQVQFPNLVREDVEAGRVGAVGLFRPQFLVVAAIVMFFGLLIAGNSGGSTGAISPPGLLFGLVPAAAAGFVLLLNLTYWLMYTSHRPQLMARVPARWLKGKAKNLGYLR